MLKGYTNKTAIENYMLIFIDSTFDAQIDEWIETAENIIDAETNRDFSVASGPASDRVYDGADLDTLYIDPVSNITAVKLSPTDTALDADQYTLYPANSTLKNRIKLNFLKFPKGNQNIVVTGGFGIPDVKKDIKFAATVIVAGIINNAWADESEVSSLTIGRYSVTYKTPKQEDDFANVQEILDRNKKYSF